VADSGIDLDSCYFYDGDFSDYQTVNHATIQVSTSAVRFPFYDGSLPSSDGASQRHRKVCAIPVQVHCMHAIAAVGAKWFKQALHDRGRARG